MSTRLIRQISMYCAGALALIWLDGCSTQEQRLPPRIRLNLDEHPVKAVLLGTSSSSGPEVSLDDLGRIRAPASLALLIPRDESLYVIDPPPSILEQLAGVTPPPPMGNLAHKAVTGILLTHFDADVFRGILALMAVVPSGRSIPLFGDHHMLAALAEAGSSGKLSILYKLDFHLLTHGFEFQLGRTVRVTSLASAAGAGCSYVGYRIRGGQRALLYLPFCATLDTIHAALVERRYGSVQIALLDATRCERRDPPQSCHPPLMELLGRLRPGRLSGLLVDLTNIPPASSTIDPNGRCRTLLRDHGWNLGVDGTEYWL